ncbi:MAG: DUF4334 domain-containing protein [Bacteroidota bacterium]
MTISELLTKRKASTADGLAIFDQLGPVTLDFMLGRWRGFEIATGHPIEGLLDCSGWYGKLFEDEEHVHPLLIYSLNKKQLYAINPLLIPLGINFPKIGLLRIALALLKPILKTRKAKARIRMIECRGKVTGTMVYDEKGIFDHFAKIDEHTMFGMMDLKGSEKPYFFVLEHDTAPYRLQL